MTETPGEPQQQQPQPPYYPPPPSYPPPPPPYGQVPSYPYGYYPPRPTNGFAIASLICAIASFFTLGLTSVLAVVFGHVARSQVRRRGENGAGLALAGLIIGYVVLALFLLVIGVFVFGSGIESSFDDGQGI